MKKEEIKVLVDAKKLATHTLIVTNNLNNFPKKYRFTLVDKIVRCSLDICNYIIEANTYSGEIRRKWQTKAITECDKMKLYIEISLVALHPKCSINYWTSLIDDIERQLRNWRRSTK